MKIDKTNLSHWLQLALFAINVFGAIVLRPFRRAHSKRRIVLYGHKLSGNLLAIHAYLTASRSQHFDVAFLTMDKQYHRELIAGGVASVLASRPQAVALLSKADAIVSDHGLHAMQPMLSFSDLKFFDAWHGIPFKGFDADDFRPQHRYDETWVSSPLLAKMYVERFGFDPAKVQVTGYARTDRLVRGDGDAAAIRSRLGLDGKDAGKIVLFAPTWKQDADQRSIFPFGLDERTFFNRLSELAARTGSTFVMRAHINSGNGIQGAWERIVNRPHAQFPDTEELLLVSDILVCDWSSIAFDYLLLQRPTIFLDVEAPFAKGFSLGPEYRFGAIVAGMDELMESLERYLRHPSDYQARFAQRAAQIRNDVYGDFADGLATARCVERLDRGIAATR